MVHMFFRCNSGHYFQGHVCPWDGWSHPEFSKALKIAQNIHIQKTPLTRDELQRHHVSEEVLRRIVLIEFGDTNAEFTGIYPYQLVVEDDVYELRELGKIFK